MKIIHIGFYPLDTTSIKGGVEASIYGLTVEQAKIEQLFVIDIPRREIDMDYTEEINGITVYRFSVKGATNYSSIFRLKTILVMIRGLQPTICHIHTTSLFSFLTFLLLRISSIKTIVTVHGLAHIEKRNLWLKQHSIRNLFKYIAQSLTEFIFLSTCSTVIVDTQYVADTIKLYRKQGRIFRMPICKVIPQGVNEAFFHLENTPIQYQLLSVGAISKRKGHLHLIDALVKVKAEFPNFSMTIAGALSDRNYYQLIQNRILDKGLEQNIQIYPDVSFKQILNFYQNAAIFVLHSEEESQGIVFCEAMVAGKAIVATNVGGIPNVIENNVNGLLSDFGDMDTFANNIIKLLEDDSLRKEMQKNNRIRSHKYEWKSIAEEIMVLYKSLIYIS